MGRGASSCRRRESCSPSSRDRGRKSRSTPPTVRVSPTRMGVRWETWTPLTWVPPLEPRSVTHQEPDSSRRRAACWRETVEKLRRISAEEERPRIFSQWSMGREPPPGQAELSPLLRGVGDPQQAADGPHQHQQGEDGEEEADQGGVPPDGLGVLCQPGAQELGKGLEGGD